MTRSFITLALLSTAAAAQYASTVDNLETFPTVVNDLSSYDTSSLLAGFPTATLAPNNAPSYETGAPSYNSAPAPYESAPPSYNSAPAPYESAPPSYNSAPAPYESAPPSYNSAPPTYQSSPALYNSEAPVPTETAQPVYGGSSEAPSPTYAAPTLVTSYSAAVPLGTGAPHSNGTVTGGGNSTNPTVPSIPSASASGAFESGAGMFTVKLPVVLGALGLVFAML